MVIQANPGLSCLIPFPLSISAVGKGASLCIFFSVCTFGQKAGKKRNKARCLEILRKDGEKRLPEEERGVSGGQEQM